MSKITRTITCLVAFCLMLGGIALADEPCGIGEAASHDAPILSQESGVKPASKNIDTKPASTVDVAANTGTTAPISNDSGTRGFVTRMYQVVLGREPDEAGLNDWVSQLESGKAKAAEMVTEVSDPPE